MSVEGHVLQFVLVLVAVLAYEGSLQFALSARMEFLYLDLLRKIHIVNGHQ